MGLCMNVAQIRSLTSTAKCLLTEMTIPPPMPTTQNARRQRTPRRCAVMMQAAMMLSANKYVLRENRRNFLSAPRPETGDLRRAC
jgi:hypothetical protein